MTALLAWILLVLAAAPAHADSRTYHMEGQVTSITPDANDPTAALAALGVVEGAAVKVDWTVDLAKPVTNAATPPLDKADYDGAVTSLEVTIGSWNAQLIAPTSPGQDVVSVADDSYSLVDELHVASPGADTGGLVQGSGALSIALDFLDSSQMASSNTSLDQNPALYPQRTGVVQGPNGSIDFDIVAAPGATCQLAELAAAAKLCQSRLKCLSTRAKSPAKDPGGDKLDACEGKADQAFLTAFAKADFAAQKKGLSCGGNELALGQLSDLDGRVNDVSDEVDAVSPPNAALASTWLGAAGTACAAGLKAESANARKPDPAKLAAARAKARAKLLTSAGKAVTKAEQKGAVFDPEPDARALADTVDQTIDDTSAALGGG